MNDFQQLAELKTIVVALMYLFSAVLFIVGIKRLAKPKTAASGNLTGALGMFIAFITAFVDFGIVIDVESEAVQFQFDQWMIIAGAVVLGTVVGLMSALRVKMTGMPQLVAVFNGFGGGASLLVAGVFYQFSLAANGVDLGLSETTATVVSGLIGAVALSGSLIAFGKLQGLRIVPDHPVRFRGDLWIKGLVLAVAVTFGVLLFIQPTPLTYWLIVAAALLLGVLLVIGIGGADMPVVIALLNAYSGLAAAATGFVLNNIVLIIAGSIVGASGLILTMLMCKAMNRSLMNVIFGGFGGKAVVVSDDIYEGKITSTSAEEVAMVLESAQRVVIVPGYGLAVARAATPVRLLTEALEKQGIEVVFGIHPVAGRMPGHMNVLLAEESIPYDKLLDLDQVNPTFAKTDVVLVIGANDVVNPSARDADSAIAGMPILDVDLARTVIVIKRSLSPGFAGIPNPLFTRDNTMMLFGDGKAVVEAINTAYRESL